jgi:N-acetyl-alpha-D-glucosaminyl L-malate synthase BshA
MRVRKEIPSVLLMVGDGPERGNTERLARKYGIENNIHFYGKQDNIEEFIGISDLLLLPSETESFGLVALEAMACEVPVIATNVGGVPEVVRNGKDGFLTEPGNVEKMTDFSLKILEDDSTRVLMGKTARQSARDRFCSTKIIPAYEAFYRKVLDPGC